MTPSDKRRKASSSRRRAKELAGEEIEVKLRLEDRFAILRQLKRLKAKPLTERVHEMNTLYDTADGSLAANGQLIRIRVERTTTGHASAEPSQRPKKAQPRTAGPSMRAILTHKGPPRTPSGASRYKVREEEESQVEDPEALAKAFQAIGLLPWFRYEKYRSTYSLPGIAGLKVELDETPIGDFLELEGPPAAIDRAAKRLGFSASRYITKSYGALFLEYEGVAADSETGEPMPADRPRDMFFKPSR